MAETRVVVYYERVCARCSGATCGDEGPGYCPKCRKAWAYLPNAQTWLHSVGAEKVR